MDNKPKIALSNKVILKVAYTYTEGDKLSFYRIFCLWTVPKLYLQEPKKVLGTTYLIGCIKFIDQ